VVAAERTNNVSAEVLAIWIPAVWLVCNQRATQDGQRHAPGLSHTAKATINLSPNKSWDNAPGEIDECKKGSLHELNQEQWTFYPHQRHFREHDRALFHRVQLDLCTHPRKCISGSHICALPTAQCTTPEQWFGGVLELANANTEPHQRVERV